MTVREKVFSFRREVFLIILLGIKRKVQVYWDAVQVFKRFCICAEEVNISVFFSVLFLELQEEYKEPVIIAIMMFLVIERFVKNVMGLFL